MLRELGYWVVEAADRPSALILLRDGDGYVVDLLFTDVVLPSGMSGAPRQRSLFDPAGPQDIVTAGYARNAIVHQGRLDPGVELITKPFSYADLAERVRDIRDER